MKLRRIHAVLLAMLGGVMLCSLMACQKKSNPSANTSAGGGVSSQAVLTLQGAPR